VKRWSAGECAAMLATLRRLGRRRWICTRIGERGAQLEASERAEGKPERSFSERAERSLRDAGKTLKGVEGATPEERAMIHLEQARVYALLQLADDIRQSRRG